LKSGIRKNKSVYKEIKSEQGSYLDESYMVSLDNIEIISETSKEENHSPRQFNQDLIGLLWAYTEAEKRVLSLL
jgi:hypothetical protein